MKAGCSRISRASSEPSHNHQHRPGPDGPKEEGPELTPLESARSPPGLLQVDEYADDVRIGIDIDYGAWKVALDSTKWIDVNELIELDLSSTAGQIGDYLWERWMEAFRSLCGTNKPNDL